MFLFYFILKINIGQQREMFFSTFLQYAGFLWTSIFFLTWERFESCPFNSEMVRFHETPVFSEHIGQILKLWVENVVWYLHTNKINLLTGFLKGWEPQTSTWSSATGQDLYPKCRQVNGTCLALWLCHTQRAKTFKWSILWTCDYWEFCTDYHEMLYKCK